MRYFEFRDLRPVVIGILICVLLFAAVYPCSKIYQTAKAAEAVKTEEKGAAQEIKTAELPDFLKDVEWPAREPLPKREPHPAIFADPGVPAAVEDTPETPAAEEQTALIVNGYTAPAPWAERPVVAAWEEMRGVWFSFFDWYWLPRNSEAAFRGAVRDVMTNIRGMNLNTIILHVHSHSDACYPSEYFPMSRYAAGKMGGSLPYDPLEVMIEEAHAQGIAPHRLRNPGFLRRRDLGGVPGGFHRETVVERPG